MLSDPLFSAIENICESVRLAPPRLAAGTACDWRAVVRKARSCDVLFSMSGSWRTEAELAAISYLAGSVRRATFYVDPWRQELPKIRRGIQLFKIDMALLPYREAFDLLAPQYPAGKVAVLPFAADTSVFRDRGTLRDIDILWLGRRHEPLHRAILSYAEANGLNYLDRERTGIIENPEDLGKLAARARYFACTPSDMGGPRDTGGFSPLIMRYLEGLAAGCRLLGVLPRSGEFEAILPRGSILELAPDGSDFAARFSADSLSQHWQGDVKRASAIVHQEHSWNARAHTIVDIINTSFSG